MAAARQSAIRSWIADAPRRFAAFRHAFGILLILILVSLAFQVATPDEGWARWVTILLQGATLMIALIASRISTLLIRFAGVVVAIAILGSTGLLVGPGDVGQETGRGLSLVLAALAPVAIAIGVVSEVRERGRVTIRAMFGGLCIYLLLGILFAFAYGVVAALESEPFFAQGAAETQSNFLYFSFVTQTTTGFGDLTAATGVGRALAVTEALIGQIYLVTVVALIVGNLGRSRGDRIH